MSSLERVQPEAPSRHVATPEGTEAGLLRRPPEEYAKSSRLGVPAPRSVMFASRIYLHDLMEVTAGEPVRQECLKGRPNGGSVRTFIRGQVSPGDEGIKSCVVHANRKPLKFVTAVPRATCW